MDSEDGDFSFPAPGEKEESFVGQGHIIKTCLYYWLDALHKNEDEPIYGFWLAFFAITALNASLALALNDTSNKSALSKKSGKRKHERQWRKMLDGIKKIRAKIARGEKISPEEELNEDEDLNKILNKYDDIKKIRDRKNRGEKISLEDEKKINKLNEYEAIQKIHAKKDRGEKISQKEANKLAIYYKESIADVSELIKRAEGGLGKSVLKKPLSLSEKDKKAIKYLRGYRNDLTHGKLLNSSFSLDFSEIKNLLKPAYRIIYDVLFGENAPKITLNNCWAETQKIKPVINAMSEFYKYPENN